MKFKLLATSVCSAFAMLASAATAQFFPDNDSGYTVQEIGMALNGMDHNGDRLVFSGRTTSNGTFYYLVSIPQTQQGFAIGGIGCRNAERRCEGMGIAAFLEGAPSLGAINEFNVTENYGKLSVPRAGIFRLVNEEFLYGGVSALNVRGSVLIFINKLNLVIGNSGRSAANKIDSGRDEEGAEPVQTVSTISLTSVDSPVIDQMDTLMDDLSGRDSTMPEDVPVDDLDDEPQL